jgi:hypothetical protein
MGVKDGEGTLRREEEVVRAESPPARRFRPYHPPAFRFERVFETMALACGKISPTQAHCRFNRKSS